MNIEIFSDIKRLMGRKFKDPQVQTNLKHWPFKVVNSEGKPKIQIKLNEEFKFFYPEEISAMILEKMKNIAEGFLEREVNYAVITVPAYFNNAQRQATIDAAKIAGLNVLSLIKDPLAAAFAYGFSTKNGSASNVLVFDLRDSTFDVSILSVQGTSFKVKGYDGDSNLGGEDFNNNMVNYIIQEFKQMYNVSLSDNQSARARIRVACEKAKRALTAATNAKISIERLYEHKSFVSTISRERFEMLNTQLFRKTISCVEKALVAANTKREDIDKIILVGESTKIPKIRSLLQEFFYGKELYRSLNPEEVVAYGELRNVS